MADLLTGLRIALLPILWWQAVVGHGYWVGLGLVAAAATDVLDGRLARRLRQDSPRGAQFDAIADILLLVSAAGWIEVLHPEIVRDNALLVASPLAVYLVSLAVGCIKFRRLVNTQLYLPKVAGCLLYLFAVVTLVSGGYNRLLLALAAAAFTLSSAEMLAAELLFANPGESRGSVLLRVRRIEITTNQATDSARKPRSQAPMSNAPGNSATPTSSNPTAATPNAKESRP